MGGGAAGAERAETLDEPAKEGGMLWAASTRRGHSPSAGSQSSGTKWGGCLHETKRVVRYLERNERFCKSRSTAFLAARRLLHWALMPCSIPPGRALVYGFGVAVNSTATLEAGDSDLPACATFNCRDPPRSAAPDLRGQAAGGRPHARGLQHPEGYVRKSHKQEDPPRARTCVCLRCWDPPVVCAGPTQSLGPPVS